MFGSKNFYITDNDKEWVHEVFQWMIRSYGYPQPGFSPILFTDEFFPISFAQKETAIEPLIIDLCDLLNIDPSKISFEIETDITDTYGTPYEIQGVPFESELELIKLEDGYHYKLYFANALLKNPKRLAFNAILLFIQIDLSKGDIEWIGSEDHYFHFYLIGIYTGWGVILAQTMIDVGSKNDGVWETKWRYVSPMPVPLMAYGLALHSDMIEQKKPVWKNFLPASIKTQYEKAILYIEKHGNPFFNRQELMANRSFNEALQQSENKEFDKSIESYQKSLFLTSNDNLKATVYNNIGYNYNLVSNFEKAVAYFQKALELSPGFAYANDNLGFALIMMGETETGKDHLMLAMGSENNDPAYTYKNLAIYHQKRNEPGKARDNFTKAFSHITLPVDQLEYFYARFLYEQGEKNEALKYLQIAVDKKEQDAIDWMAEIQNLT